MNIKALVATIVLAVLTVALSPAVSGIGIHAPYAPFLTYNFWEIPIVVAFLLISPLVGVLISLLNASIMFAFAPGPLPTGTLYSLIAVFSMLTGIYIARRLLTR